MAGVSRTLDDAARDRIHHLWDELAAFEASRYDDALMHLLHSVASIIDAQNAYWVGAVRTAGDRRDAVHRWRPRAIRYLRPPANDRGRSPRRTRTPVGDEGDELTSAYTRRAGTYRAYRMRDLISSDWFASEAYANYVRRGVHDSLVVVAPVEAGTEAYHGFIRTRPDSPFSEADRDIALYAMRGLTWFHRRALLAHGVLAAKSVLSPRERRVLAGLLTDRPEKLIAADLQVSPATVHTYVRDILRKFGVSGRKGLMALWLGQRR